MTNIINEKACPFCKGINLCMAKSEQPCWCTHLHRPTQLTDLVPSDLKRKSCICLACIDAYNKNPTLFKANISVE